MDKNIGTAILIALGLGLLLLFITKKEPFAPALTSGYPIYQPLKLSPVGSLARQEAGLLHYKNKETRNVEWSDDGLPTKIVIEREYYQLP